ncbi:hypothetical protein [Bradyrhizobium ottawaense]|uniref:hypothetical protein n=1 Tax=Bradyrhizobium ottawaense TaxID=931866 RepID=UPI003FA0771E
MALIVGARTFDRLLAGVRFDEVDGDILFVYAKDEDTAAKIEDAFARGREGGGGRGIVRSAADSRHGIH